MGLFDFIKKKEQINKEDVIDELIAFSKQAIALSTVEIEDTGSFLPFGGVLTIDNSFQQIVYHDPSKTTIDHREHATLVQKLVMQKYKDSNCKLIFMVFDGIAHLPIGDIDSINVRVSNKAARVHKLLTYPYKIIKGKVDLVDKDNPIIKNV